MEKYLALIFFSFCASAFATDSVTIYVSEVGFSIGDSPESLSSESLSQKLKIRGVESVILAVDVCAGPVQVADVYLVLQKLNINEVDINGVGELKPAGCGNV